MRITGEGAHVIMVCWAREFIRIFKKCGVKIYFIYVYVDDVRIGTKLFK